MSSIQLRQISLPKWELPVDFPSVPINIYQERYAACLQTMHAEDIDFMLVFADREHAANFSWFTGLDPRFEEALLLVSRDGRRKILFGNECFGALGVALPETENALFQDFSLHGQDRSKSQTLEELLRAFGLTSGCRVGTAYYKFFYDAGRNVLRGKLDIPAYLADLLREICGEASRVLNYNDLLMDASYGWRNHNCLEELVQFEWASTRTSQAFRNMLAELRPGIREYELARHFQSDGLPHSCHPMCSTGEKARFGLSSPSARQVQMADSFTAAFGLRGALSCRAGMVAAGPDDLDPQTAAYYEQFWRNYYQTVIAWYEAVGIGVRAETVWQACESARNPELFDFALNTGHTIHTDEWVDSPFYKGSEVELYSGMALQMDIIPANLKRPVAANAEDGIVLADESLRKAWASHYAESWQRIQERRKFMAILGIDLPEEILPLSNMPGCFAPYLLRPDWVAVVE